VGGSSAVGWEDVRKKYWMGIRTSWEGVMREALNRCGWRTSVHICVGLRWLGAAMSC
jgi:hypothetical protein